MNMKVSIMSDWNICYGIDYSKFWAEVIDISDDDFGKIQNKTHKFDIETKTLIELPTEEPKKLTKAEKDAIAEAEAKLLEEQEIQETEKLILRKQAMELLGKDTTAIELEISKKLPKKK